MRISKKIIVGGLAAVAAAIVIAGCTTDSGAVNNANEADQAAAGIALILKNLPVPIFPTSELRKNTIEVEAIQALGSPTTSFFFPEGTAGKVAPVKVCASQGMPVHATDQLSNPQQVIGTGNSNAVTIPQMDPNGIYAGNSSGTYVLCLKPNGQPQMTYWEGPVETESGAAVWDAATNSIKDIGPSQLPVCTIVHAQPGDGTNLTPGKPYYHCVDVTKKQK